MPRLILLVLPFSQANVVLKEKETFIEYLQKQLNETKSKLDSEVSKFMFDIKIFKLILGICKCNYKHVDNYHLQQSKLLALFLSIIVMILFHQKCVL